MLWSSSSNSASSICICAGVYNVTAQCIDQTVVQNVEKAIQTNLNNPSTEGTVIRLRLPELTEERRQELVKVVKKYIEDGKVAIRHIRRDEMDDIKKDDSLSEDEVKSFQEEIRRNR